MNNPHIERFLTESVSGDREPGTGLGADEIYGLYTSWCLLNASDPLPASELWEALKEHNIRPGDKTITMTGPAAVDYILASAPSLI
ncbi:hypothetical protein FHJ30_20555 [Arthrobacter sp. BB-1]|uniref:hypothetical protein n=1 Tax=unclassified Arthrobacter TaxID=235627 RepID=UPI0011127AD1|nr:MULTISPECIES: hypothetical protein [unclassified Arthrobacter]TNB67699.1 hypothetical protein FHJ30_20555 [Arthrobacter sp. BB-1]